MRLRDEPQFLSLSNENNSLIHLLESFREVQKTRRKALGTHKNSVNGSYFLICLKPNLYFSRGIFSSEAKPCPTAELKSARRASYFQSEACPHADAEAGVLHRAAKVAGARKPRRAWSGDPGGPQPHPFSLGSARGRHPLPTGSARQGPAASSAEDAAVGVLKRGGGSRRGADGRRLRREKESSRSLPALPKLETADSRGTKPPAPR